MLALVGAALAVLVSDLHPASNPGRGGTIAGPYSYLLASSTDLGPSHRANTQLTAALHGVINIQKGRVKQSNFYDYPILRIDTKADFQERANLEALHAAMQKLSSLGVRTLGAVVIGEKAETYGYPRR